MAVIAIVESRADAASVHICDQLRSLTDWDRGEDTTRPDGEGGGTYYRAGKFELRTFDALHLDLVRPAEAFSEPPELLVFASRHSGETGPLLTGHFTGNFGPAEYGGADRSVAEAAPNALCALLAAFDEHAPDGYEVGMECTHHGPTDVGCPSLFVELGSDEAQWTDDAAAEAVARAILALDGVEPYRFERSDQGAGADTSRARTRHLVGFGGGHYVPRFERIVRETPWAVGHVAPDWALAALTDPADESDLIGSAFEASAAEFAVVEGEHPALTETIANLGYRVVSEAWVREVDDRPLALVEAVEAVLGPIADGVRFGDRRTDSFDVLTLPSELVGAVEGIDPERTWDAVAGASVAIETENGGSRLGERIAVPADDEASRSPTGLPRTIVDSLAEILRDGYEDVEVTDDAVVVAETAFDPDRAAELGVPSGPAFGRLADGESVTVDGRLVDSEDVHVERTTRFSI